MDLQLTGKRAVVSGSTAGIGCGIAEALAREGALVVINGRTETAVSKARAALRESTGQEVEGFSGDLGTASAADALAKAFPDVDIVVNNLGIFEPKAFEEIPDEDWRRLFEVNARRGRLRGRHVEAEGDHTEGIRSGVLCDGAPDLPHQAVCDAGGSRVDGRVRGEPACVG
jgi:NAD(P)-dependent dehydrogenase (short-subunit alcohol dehydrogenase family)